MNGAGPFIHDPLDSVSAAAALGVASEAGKDLAHAGLSRLFCDHRPHLMVAEHITRTDDHRLFLTNTNESDEDRHKRGAPPSGKLDGFHSSHLGVAKRRLADLDGYAFQLLPRHRERLLLRLAYATHTRGEPVVELARSFMRPPV